MWDPEKKQGYMFSYLSPEERVSRDHPLRRVKALADVALRIAIWLLLEQRV